MSPEEYTNVEIAYQPIATSVGHRWTATIGDYDGSGDSLEGALFALIGSLYEDVKDK